MMIEVRDESADLRGHLYLVGELDARCKNIVIPYVHDGRFHELLLSVERVRLDNTRWMALRASSQDIDLLKRCHKFTPIEAASHPK